MGLLSRKNRPEEIVRQTLVNVMIKKLGYPAELIAIEKELTQLPHLSFSPKDIPKRRVDVVVFAKEKRTQSLVPLILIECKAVPLTPQLAQQVIGYNAFVRSPFIALANASQILTGYFDAQAGLYRFEPGLPSYHQFNVRISDQIRHLA